jgi:hypothetical protein
MSRTTVVDVPILKRGFHVHPRKGASLVEFATTLPGSRWTDHPADMQRTLTAISFAVNDYTSDDGRMALLAWAPWLVGTRGDPADDELDAMLVGVAGAAALRHCEPEMAARLAPAMAALTWREPADHGPLHNWWQRIHRRRSAVRLVGQAAAVLARTAHADDNLRQLLADAVNTTRRRAGLPAVTVSAAGHRSWPRAQLIEVQLRIPDGSESAYNHCTSIPLHWPAPLADAWAARVIELGDHTSNL